MIEVLSRSQCQRDDKYIFILLTLRVDRELRNWGGGVLLLAREGGYKGGFAHQFTRIAVVVRAIHVWGSRSQILGGAAVFQ